MVFKDSHPKKAAPLMIVTELGIETEVKEVQPPKAYSPMLVTEFGIETDIKEVHS